jgi:hypothetical protein
VIAVLALGVRSAYRHGHEEDAAGNGVLVTRYCNFGSVSEAQFAGCLEHVTPEQIRHRATPAARFARGEITCAQGGGPDCNDDIGP